MATSNRPAKSPERAVPIQFGEQALAVELVDRLSANALATSKAIRIRRGARFTNRDFSQLLRHEAYVHVAQAMQVDLDGLVVVTIHALQPNALKPPRR
jgi:hypothetical protein